MPFDVLCKEITNHNHQFLLLQHEHFSNFAY